MARICQLAHVETNYNFLAPLFHGLRAEGHDVVAACNIDAGGRYLRQYLGDEYTVHQVRGARTLGWRTFTTELAGLARYLRRERFDVLHVHNPLVAIQARLAARIARIPVVIYHVHGFVFHEGMGRLAYRVAHAIERFFARHLTDALVTVSEEDWELAQRAGFCARPEQIIHAPGVGIDLQRFQPRGPDDDTERKVCRRELGIPSDAVAVAFVGRLVAAKGIRELIAAFESLAAVHPDLWLVIVGDTLDSERDQTIQPFLDRVREGAAGRRLVLAGRREDVPRLLHAVDGFVLPSYREGMPVSLLEAMASGLPCVATHIRGCREAIEDGVSGLLVSPRDADELARALDRLATDLALRQRLGQAARQRVVARYSVAASLEPQLELYRRLIGNLSQERRG